MNPLPAIIDPMEILAKDYPSFHAAADALEEALMALPHDTILPSHVITPGLYSRRLRVPAGSVVVTKIHRREHQLVVFSGSATVLHEGGACIIRGGFSGITPAGTRRIVIVHEDTDWMTFHPTLETDLDAIEADLILPRHLLGEPLNPLTP